MRILSFCLAVFVLFSSFLYAVEYPRRDLRGYGALSAAFQRGERSSLMEIRCENVDKARIVHAKYRSDLLLMGGVTKIDVDGKPAYEVESQGLIAVFRKDATVFVVAATEKAALKKEIVSRGAGAVFEPEVEVPMLLDSWDKFAFRFYYRPWITLDGDYRHPQWIQYDPLKTEFDHAEKFGRSGFVFWAEMHVADTARNMTNQTWWDWANRAAGRRKLPVVVNTVTPIPDSVSWVANRYREQTQQFMPDFVGSFHGVGEPGSGGVGRVSWNATTAKDWELRTLAQLVREYSRQDHVIDFLEPQGEARHGDYDIFVEYGPVADANYRDFLRKKYKDLATLSLRWFGDAGRLQSWDDVRVPEVASFAGWNETAIDLKGDWRVRYEPDRPRDAPRPTAENIAGSEAPDDWFAESFDDADWAVLPAPGHDRAKFSRRAPAVFRRTIDVPADWLEKHPRVWLYVWDLNQAYWHSVQAWVNGQKIGDEPVRHPRDHWFAPEASAAIKPGKNQITLRLPRGFLGYKIYLATEPPKAYPALEAGKNAQWADFAAWYASTRHDIYRRGLEMIRQNDDERGIVLMAPDGFASGLKALAAEHGARFHNTGYMASNWAENLPMMMRSEGLPFSLEPGGPAGNLPDLKRMLGHYLTEGVNAIHYYIHIGSILWHDDMRRYFEENRNILGNMGRVHVPQAEAALFLSERVGNLTTFPWDIDQDVNMHSGYLPGRINGELLPDYPMDALGDLDFERGIASAYKVIVDTNTSILDEKTSNDIERWVRDGGVFVTLYQTGRHTPETRDAWPISRLSGYEVVHVDPLTEQGDPVAMRTFRFAPEQNVLDESEWKGNDFRAHGLSLKKSAPECRDLLLWEDGTVAAGVRSLGKGFVVHLGLRHLNKYAWRGNREANAKLFRQLFAWRGLQKQPGRADDAFLRHNVSNNGLFDVWVLWNDRNEDRTAKLRIDKTGVAPWGIRIKDGRRLTLDADDGKVFWNDIAIPAQETVVLATPRGEILDAPRRWFELQREWWKGGRGRLTESKPLEKDRWTEDISNGWKWKFLPEGEAAPEAFSQREFDDSGWENGKVDVWAVPEEHPTRHAILRKRFTVPKGWTDGEIDLYLKSPFASIGLGKLRVRLDGREIQEPNDHSRNGVYRRITGEVRPGKEHVLTVEVFGEGVVPGLRGNAWLSFIPKPVASMDLTGDWSMSQDALTWSEPIPLPGRWQDALLARRTVEIPEEWAGKTVCFRMKSDWGLTGVIVNGRYVRRHHHIIGEFTHLNITPFLKPGEKNVIEIVANTQPATTHLREIGLDAYDSSLTYP